MEEKLKHHNSDCKAVADRFFDCSVTLLCWAWFIFGFIFFFSWRYLFIFISQKDTTSGFQKLNHQFYQVLFLILKYTAPRHQIRINEGVVAIGSAVIVCNHLSYLDPLFLISIFRQHRTIVKNRFFLMPIFGWIIKKSGYLPGIAQGRFSGLMIAQMESLAQHFQKGGILFVFPEGTRSRNGKIGSFNSGAFKIARMYKVPVYVLRITNTDKLFTPGRFFFKTRVHNTIEITIIDRIDNSSLDVPYSASEMEHTVRKAYEVNEP